MANSGSQPARDGETLDYRLMTGCAHALHETCPRCVCPSCGTRAIQTDELGWVPVPARDGETLRPGETTNG